MSDGKSIALLLIVIALAGMYLHSGGVLETSFTKLQSGTVNTSTEKQSIAELGVAILIYIIAISLLPDEWAFPLSAIIVLGALLVNHENQGSNDLIGVINGLFTSGGAT